MGTLRKSEVHVILYHGLESVARKNATMTDCSNLVQASAAWTHMSIMFLSKARANEPSQASLSPRFRVPEV